MSFIMDALLEVFLFVTSDRVLTISITRLFCEAIQSGSVMVAAFKSLVAWDALTLQSATPTQCVAKMVGAILCRFSIEGMSECLSIRRSQLSGFLTKCFKGPDTFRKINRPL
jgi:hypothetical protein